MTPNAPAWVRFLWSAAWTFGQRRQVVRAWTWANTNRAAVSLQNLAFRMAHPIRHARLREWLRSQRYSIEA